VTAALDPSDALGLVLRSGFEQQGGLGASRPRAQGRSCSGLGDRASCEVEGSDRRRSRNIKDGKKRTRKLQKTYPGYVLVNMELIGRRVWAFVRETRSVPATSSAAAATCAHSGSRASRSPDEVRTSAPHGRRASSRPRSPTRVQRKVISIKTGTFENTDAVVEEVASTREGSLDVSRAPSSGAPTPVALRYWQAEPPQLELPPSAVRLAWDGATSGDRIMAKEVTANREAAVPGRAGHACPARRSRARSARR
jgi:transcription antitermination factor NusG